MTKQRSGSRGENDTIRIDTRNKWFNLCLVGICFLLLLAVRLQVNQNTTGDEPYYLLMDYSLVHDRDLSLTNNYLHKDFLGFYKNTVLTPQGGTQTISNKYAVKGYSSHGIGLPLFVLPGFAVAAKTGAVFTMVLLATGVVCLTWVWTKNTTGNRKIAYIAAGLLMICYFFNGLVGAMYPDMLIAAITLATLIMLERYYKKTGYQAIIGILLGFLILVHFKTVVLVGPALLVLSYRIWKSERRLPWTALIIVAISLAYYFITLHQWFGLWDLSTIEGGQSFAANPFHNASAMLFDSNRGLLIYNPVLLLIFVGLPIWLKKHFISLVITLVVLLPTIITLCLIPNWNGSAAPTDRYVMEFLPAFIPALAFAIVELNKVWQRIIVFILAAATFLISLDATMIKFPYIDGDLIAPRSPLFKQIQQHTGLALDRMLPTYTNATILLGKHGILKLMFDYILILVALAYGYYLAIRAQANC